MQERDTYLEQVREDILRTAKFCMHKIQNDGERGLELCKIRCEHRMKHYGHKIGLAAYRKAALGVAKECIREKEYDTAKIIIILVLVI